MFVFLISSVPPWLGQPGLVLQFLRDLSRESSYNFFRDTSRDSFRDCSWHSYWVHRQTFSLESSRNSFQDSYCTANASVIYVEISPGILPEIRLGIPQRLSFGILHICIDPYKNFSWKIRNSLLSMMHA